MRIRKFLFVITFAAIGFAVVSCDMTTVISPRIDVSRQLVRTNLSGVCDTIMLDDSLNIGDTVRMGLLLNGYYDPLVSFVASADESKVHLSLNWPDTLGGITAESDPAHAKLIFIPDSVSACLTTLSYVPVEAGSHQINLTLTSSAKAPYSQGALQFNIAVRKP